jgi:hypothetical protein
MGSAIRARVRLPGPVRIAFAAALAGLLLTLAAAPRAEAGTYDVWSCRGPAGESLPTHAWALTTLDEPPRGGIVVEDTCASGGALTLAISPSVAVPSSLKPTALAAFVPPPGVQVTAYTLRRSLRTWPAWLLGDFRYEAGVIERAAGSPLQRGCASISAPCTAVGNADDPDDPGNVDPRSALALDRVELFASCMTDGCTGLLPVLRDGDVAAELKLFGARIELSDPTAPQVTALGGAVAGDSPLTGPGTLVVESADAGAGIAAVTVSIDGGPATTQAPAGPDGACALPYTRPQPCPTAATRSFDVDTTALAPGEHSASGTVTDAAGNVTSFGPVAFTVAPPPEVPMAPPAPPAPPPIVIPPPPQPDLRNGRPAVTRPQLTLRRTEIEHAAGRRAWVSGVLRTSAGVPIAGARLTLSADPIGRGAGDERALGPVTTRRDGRFRARVDGQGAKRVTVASTLGGAPTMRATAIVRERSALSIARSRARVGRGGAVVLSGRLTGAGAAAARAVVEVQAIVSGRWRAVETVRTTPDGRWRWRYRFRYVTRDTVFSFRTLVRRTTGWPWPTLRSPTIRVRVDGAP